MSKKRPDRQGVAVLLLQQQQLLDIRTRAVVGPYTYLLVMDGVEYRALVLVRSSDYWKKRVHLAKQQSTLLVVWEHDSCVPIVTLSLQDGKRYGTFATKRTAQVRNRYTASILLGQLMCGLQSAYDQLEQLPPSVKYRYLAQVHALTRRHRGRPIAS